MTSLFKPKDQVSAYRDRRFKGTQEDFQVALRTSCTVYIGNLSFYTTEEQIYEVFSRTGEIKKIVMGLDKNSMTPCGFCFVMYYTQEDAADSVKYISGTILDDRPVRVDFDWGFEDGRQWGRGRSGGQVRDEYRTDFDPGRGGYGKLVQHELDARRFGDPGVGGALMAPFQAHFSPPQVGGPHGFRGHHREGGPRKRQRAEDGVHPPDGVKAGHPAGDASHQQGKNPRFRERGDDSDEDEAGKT